MFFMPFMSFLFRVLRKCPSAGVERSEQLQKKTVT
jgi:hypothetical protein